jgi:hypothetical protein
MAILQEAVAEVLVGMMIRWMSECGERYAKKYLTLSTVRPGGFGEAQEAQEARLDAESD